MRGDDIESKKGLDDARTIALLALGWMLSDARRADRLLAMTGLDADALRAGVDDPGLLGAVLGLLEGYEPDLIACADAIDCRPAMLVAARRALAGQEERAGRDERAGQEDMP